MLGRNGVSAKRKRHTNHWLIMPVRADQSSPFESSSNYLHQNVNDAQILMNKTEYPYVGGEKISTTKLTTKSRLRRDRRNDSRKTLYGHDDATQSQKKSLMVKLIAHGYSFRTVLSLLSLFITVTSGSLQGGVKLNNVASLQQPTSYAWKPMVALIEHDRYGRNSVGDGDPKVQESIKEEPMIVLPGKLNDTSHHDKNGGLSSETIKFPAGALDKFDPTRASPAASNSVAIFDKPAVGENGLDTSNRPSVQKPSLTAIQQSQTQIMPISSSSSLPFETMITAASKKKKKMKMMKKKKKMEKKHKEWKKGKKHKKKKYESKKKKGGSSKKKKGKKEKKKWGMEKKGHKKKGNFKKKKWGSKKKMKKGHKKGKKGHKMLKDKGHKKKGFKKIYHKEEWGKKKKWHDIKREKKWNTKQKKWKKKWHQEKGKKYKGKHMKKYHKKNKHGKKYKKEKKSKWKKHKGEKFKKGHKKKKEEYSKKKEGGKKKKMKKMKKEMKKKKKG